MRFRQHTAAFLLAYLAWAAFGSVLAGEHVHRQAGRFVVHQHATHPDVITGDHQHPHETPSHHHHEPESDSQNAGATRHEVHWPPHHADSLLDSLLNGLTAHAPTGATSLNGLFIALPAQLMAVPREVPVSPGRIRDGTPPGPSSVFLASHNPRPPPVL